MQKTRFRTSHSGIMRRLFCICSIPRHFGESSTVQLGLWWYPPTKENPHRTSRLVNWRVNVLPLGFNKIGGNKRTCSTWEPSSHHPCLNAEPHRAIMTIATTDTSSCQGQKEADTLCQCLIIVFQFLHAHEQHVKRRIYDQSRKLPAVDISDLDLLVDSRLWAVLTQFSHVASVCWLIYHLALFTKIQTKEIKQTSSWNPNNRHRSSITNRYNWLLWTQPKPFNSRYAWQNRGNKSGPAICHPAFGWSKTSKYK